MVLRRGALLSCCSLQRCGSLIYCYASRYLRVPWMLRSCRPVISSAEFQPCVAQQVWAISLAAEPRLDLECQH